MNHDEKEFLDLLGRYRSEETKKSRRTTSMISFIIIAAWFLNIKLNDVRVLGINLEETSAIKVLTLALILLSYWFGLFIISWLHDKEIQAERDYILNMRISSLTERFNQLEKQKADREKKGHRFMGSQYPEVKGAYHTYMAQKERTGLAMRISTYISKLEIIVPVTLYSTATTILVSAVIRM